MAESVVALVVDERVRLDVRVLADGARDRRHLVGGNARELPLEQAVVVARAARGVAVRERLAHVALEVEEPARADLVRDRVAVRRDRAARGESSASSLKRRLGPVVVGEIAEGLLVAARVRQSSTFWSFGSNEIFPARPVPAAVETNDATWSISVGVSLSLKDGIPLPPLRDLLCDLLLVRAHHVEVRPDLPGRPRGLQRVAAAAALGGEDLLSGLPAPAASFDPESPPLPPPQPTVKKASTATDTAAIATRTIAEGAIRRIRRTLKRKAAVDRNGYRQAALQYSGVAEPEYSLVIPIFNEEDTVPELVNRLAGLMERLDGDAEVILVDDGSSDGATS